MFFPARLIGFEVGPNKVDIFLKAGTGVFFLNLEVYLLEHRPSGWVVAVAHLSCTQKKLSHGPPRSAGSMSVISVFRDISTVLMISSPYFRCLPILGWLQYIMISFSFEWVV